MIQFTAWPPPNWIECVIKWNWLLNTQQVHINDIYRWCEHHPSSGRFHVHGWKSTEGFAFRFENPEDATWFQLSWPNY